MVPARFVKAVSKQDGSNPTNWFIDTALSSFQPGTNCAEFGQLGRLDLRLRTVRLRAPSALGSWKAWRLSNQGFDNLIAFGPTLILDALGFRAYREFNQWFSYLYLVADRVFSVDSGPLPSYVAGR